MRGMWVVIVSQTDRLLGLQHAGGVDASAYVAKSDIPLQLILTLQRLILGRNRLSKSKAPRCWRGRLLYVQALAGSISHNNWSTQKHEHSVIAFIGGVFGAARNCYCADKI